MADTKISGLGELSIPTGTAYMPIVNTPASDTEKITWKNLLLATSDIIPAARVYNDANISATNADWTTLTFNSERFDTDTIHDTSTNSERLTCKTAGKYIIVGNAFFAANAGGDIRWIRIFYNNTNNIGIAPGIDNVNSAAMMNVCTIYDLAVNDYVTLGVYQDSGGALNITAAGNYSPEFMMIRIGD